jgi:hypothetical protein
MIQNTSSKRVISVETFFIADNFLSKHVLHKIQILHPLSCAHYSCEILNMQYQFHSAYVGGRLAQAYKSGYQDVLCHFWLAAEKLCEVID